MKKELDRRNNNQEPAPPCTCVLADKAVQTHHFVFLKDKMSIIVYFSVLHFNVVHSYLVGTIEIVVIFLSRIILFLYLWLHMCSHHFL